MMILVYAGINIYAICYVVPFGIALYAVSGGLKSTFITSWIHTGAHAANRTTSWPAT